MAWEFTIICDGCGLLVAAGSTKRRALADLLHCGGRPAPEMGPCKHLCGGCARR